MTYSECIDFLFNSLPVFQHQGASAYKPGLDNVLRLAEAMGNPHHKLKYIHVGGTNGKGSTTHSMAAVLQCAGYRTGLFTSPHLVDFRERIRVNGNMISEEAVIDFCHRYFAVKSTLDVEPSFFELTTVMALDYFAAQGVEIAVMEVGLGGRLDSTNIITPLLSIITNISFDHTALLGDTLEQIAFEKAGIIKESVPVVVSEGGQPTVRHVFKDRAKAMNAPLFFADEMKEYESYERLADNQGFIYKDTLWGDIASDLSGDCQPYNMRGILCALDVLSQTELTMPARAVREGLANVCELTGLTGRWMVLSRDPITVCDTGHNSGGWKYLAQRLIRIANGCNAKQSRLRMVLGFVNDKDISSILHLIANIDADFYFCAPDIRRARSAAELAAEAAQFGITGEPYESVMEAFKAARSQASKDDFIFIGGSNFVVAEVLLSYPLLD